MDNLPDQPSAQANITPHSPVVQGGDPVEIQQISMLIGGLVEPFARSQEFAETEKTKRIEIEANTSKSLLRYSFGLAVFILCIAILSLFLGKDQLAEKIIFSVIGFVGGFAFGKGSQGGKSQ